jgi:hypothetical protein
MRNNLEWAAPLVYLFAEAANTAQSQISRSASANASFPSQFGLLVIGRSISMQFRSMALWEFYGSTHHPAGVIRPPRKRGQTGDQVASFLAETKIFADEGDRKPLCICSCL